MATVLLLNGPNLNALGQREPHLYGSTTLQEIEDGVRRRIEGAGHVLRSFQSNSEGALVDWLHQNRQADFLLVNAGALTHTSVALRDAIELTGVPFIEIHISNVHARERFRHRSYLSDIAVGLIVGLGPQGYDLAAQYAIARLGGA
jgi:3-dehydroquinate dehydratase-2